MPTAIITGAGSGIGRATALLLAKHGHAIALVGRRRDRLESVAAEIERAGGKALPVPADVTQADQVDSMVHRVIKALNRIDVLVNNAGLAPRIPLVQLTPQQWQDVLNINLSAAFYAIRAVWPFMVEQHRAHASANTTSTIINISSMSSRDPFPGLGAYAAAKAALNMLTLVTAREGHDVGIRACCIAPAAVETEMFRTLIGNPPTISVPPDAILHPNDIAELILQACSGSLRFTSGETLFVHKRPA